MRGIRRQRGSTYWSIRYRDASGKLREESSHSIRKRDAEALLIRRKKEVLDGVKPETQRVSKITLREFAPEYLKWAKGRHRAYDRTERAVKQLVDDFGNIPLNSFTIKLLEQWQSERLHDRGNKPATINRLLAVLKNIFTKAYEYNKVAATAREQVKLVKLFKLDNQRLRYLSPKECERLIASCDGHIKPIVIMAINTGMRKGEILKLRWEHIDLENRIIKLDGSITKDRERREIPITDELSNTLRNLRTRVDVPFVFHDNTGRPFKDIKKSFASALSRAKISDYTFRDNRHTFASNFIMATGDIKSLQELLGHATLTMTLRYAHLARGHKTNAIKQFEKRLTKKISGYFVGSSGISEKRKSS
ncbi:MAG: site-specific integrase [Candidatus Latescibacteria bacterium]|jgi:integrase|nr:site-specific integrase [Candidatus Latescibacterota bacterium]